MYKEFQSADVARAAIRMALSENRSDENELREKLAKSGIISDTHVGDGSVVGAMESAIEQIKLMAMGMNLGGKIGIARWKEHLCVAVFVEVGVLHFNEVTLGMAHRVLRNDLTDEDD